MTVRAPYRNFERKIVNLATHRIAYVLAHGDIPSSLFVCHRCDNRRCVNPAHLFTGTHHDNMVDAIAKGRMTGRPRGRGARLTAAQREEIRSSAAIMRGVDAARQYGVTKAYISMIRKGIR